MCVDDYDDENAISKKPPLLIAQDTQQCTEHPTQIRGYVLVPQTQINKPAHAIITHAWVALKRQSSMKPHRGIFWKGVLEPLTHMCTDLKISKESNVLIQVIVM